VMIFRVVDPLLPLPPELLEHAAAPPAVTASARQPNRTDLVFLASLVFTEFIAPFAGTSWLLLVW
jgi:hypothetical protein